LSQTCDKMIFKKTNCHSFVTKQFFKKKLSQEYFPR